MSAKPADEVIKQLVDRRWETERRAGVDHYKPGQHVARHVKAIESDDEFYLLAYAAADGHGIVVLFCAQTDDGWARDETAVRFDGLGNHTIMSPPLSDAMIVALERAKADVD